MKTIKLIVALLLCNSSFAVSYDKLVDTCVAHIKKYEGFRSTCYYDASGNKCIGYGHRLNNDETYVSVNREQAEDILKRDFLKVVIKLQKVTNLSENRLLAMGLFCYNIGIGYFLNSSLYKAVKRGDKIDNYILKYGYYYNTKGIAVKSKKLFERRQFELWLYNL